MRKRILGLLAAFLLIMPAMPVAAVEVSQDNSIDYTFSDIDGGEITTQSEGKPKLLIFFKTGCGNCERVLPDISSSEWIKTGETDVCAIEVSGKTEDEVRDFQTNYCPEGTIRFAAGGTDGAKAGSAYSIASGGSGSFITPLIAMIDAENKMRYVTTGVISADDIEGWLSALGAGGDDSQKPDETPGGDGADKPDTVPDKNSGSKDDSREADETKAACNHVWEKVSVNDATATSDAVSAEQCVKCGAVNKYEMIPNSAYAAFLDETAKTIANAKQEEVVINTRIWTSFNRTVFDAIQSRPDVAVTVNYFYKGEEYTLRIPAGIDVSLLIDENGYGGFRYIDQVLKTLN